MEGTDFQKFLELELQVRELKQQLIKKDGFIEALQSSIQQSQKQHFYEMQTMKESFKNESSRMHNLWAKSMNDRIDEKIEFHLEQQSEKFETKLDELDNTSANIESRIDTLDQKVDNVQDTVSKVDQNVHNVNDKVGTVVQKIDSCKDEVADIRQKVDNVDGKIDQKADIVEKKVEQFNNDNISRHDGFQRKFDGQLVRFVEEGSSGVTFSPSGDSIVCSSSEGGGACLNVDSKESDTGKYEWKFKYERNGGTGDVLFGYCNGKKRPCSWNLDNKDTCLWNPVNGELHTNAKPAKAINNPLRKSEGILRFTLDLNNKKHFTVYDDEKHLSRHLWHNGPNQIVPCVCWDSDSKYKVTLLSFRRVPPTPTTTIAEPTTTTGGIAPLNFFEILRDRANR